MFDQAGEANAPAPSGPAPQGVVGIMAPQTPQEKPAPALGLPSMSSGGIAGRDRAVKEAQMAVAGKHPNPAHALGNFTRAMGVDALGDLKRSYDKGGVVRGSGGGVDDLIPASVDGREDIRIAAGEYIVPARVVSALGDGDTARGAQILDEFCDRVRAAGSQAMGGSEPMDVQSLLPQVPNERVPE